VGFEPGLADRVHFHSTFAPLSLHFYSTFCTNLEVV